MPQFLLVALYKSGSFPKNIQNFLISVKVCIKNAKNPHSSWGGVMYHKPNPNIAILNFYHTLCRNGGIKQDILAHRFYSTRYDISLLSSYLYCTPTILL